MTPEIRMAVEAAIKKQGRQRKWVADQMGVSYVQFTRIMRGSSEGSVSAWLKLFAILKLKLTVEPD